MQHRHSPLAGSLPRNTGSFSQLAQCKSSFCGSAERVSERAVRVQGPSEEDWSLCLKHNVFCQETSLEM